MEKTRKARGARAKAEAATNIRSIAYAERVKRERAEVGARAKAEA